MTIFFNSRIEEYSWLSNFYPSKVCDQYYQFDSVEHYYQCAKATNLEDFAYVRGATSAKDAKARGKKIVVASDWNDTKVNVMKTGLSLKFAQNEDLREMLKKTDGHYLVEKSPWDSFWGDGKDGTGKNIMGRLLMQLRNYWIAEMQI